MRCAIPENDLQLRLDGTICMYKGEPVYIRVDEDGRLNLYNTTDMYTPIARIRSDDPEFDVSTPPLGYFQMNVSTVGYLQRLPYRRYKQGLDKSVISCEKLGSSDGWNIGLDSIAINKMMKREYPSLAETINNLLNYRSIPYAETMSIAISNDCAMSIDMKDEISVYYKQERVGKLRNDNARTHPTVLVPSHTFAWIVSLYLREFRWMVI